MGLTPNLKKNARFTLKKCNICGQSFGPEGFAPTKSIFYPDGVIPVCNDCIDKILRDHGYNWEIVNKICQMADIPFVPKEWERLKEMTEVGLFYRYATIFLSSEFEGLDWGKYYEAFQALEARKELESELPGLADEKRSQLKRKWGENYDDEALAYLEDLLNGLLNTQNISGKLQLDQALKICKMSYEIDRKIAEGSDFDKLLSSYDKLVKTAEFTPKNTKNINDFDTCGEMMKYMEKIGWRNQFYDDVPRDVVDESIKNIQSFNQRLYIEENGIAEEIARRLEALKTTAEMENYFGTDTKHDLDGYADQGYDELINGLEDDDFKVDLSDEEGVDDV